MMLATSACVGPEKAAQTDGPIIGKQEVTVKDGRMTPETLWAMGRIGSSCVSPDGKRIAYTVSYYSVKENKSHLVIYVMNADGSGNQLLTTTAASEGEPAWIKNGSKLAFLAPDADGNSQIWEMNPDGSERVQLSSFAGGIDGFKFSPDESKVLFISQVKYGERTVDKYPDLDKASGMVIDDLMYKHWDEWVQTVPHPFVAPFAGNKVGEATDILAGEPYESPMKPFVAANSLRGVLTPNALRIPAARKLDWNMLFLPIRTFTCTTWKPSKPAISARKTLPTKTWVTTRTRSSPPTADSLPGKAWNATDTKATATAFA